MHLDWMVMNIHRKYVWGISSAVFAYVLAGVSPWAIAGADSNPGNFQPILRDPPTDGPRLKAFAAMVDEPESAVLQRLSTIPEIVPLALAAGEMRLNRKRSGKVMTITGFSILGVGAIGGLALAVSGISANCSNEVCGSDDGRIQLGLLIGAVSVGMALGIPGIIRMSSQSSLEEDAVARYRSATSTPIPSPVVTPVKSTQSQSSARTVTWPLLSFAF